MAEENPGAVEPIRFTCPGCGKIAKAPPDYAGRTCQCPKCGTNLIIPGAEPSAFVPPVSANEFAVTDDIRTTANVFTPAPAPQPPVDLFATEGLRTPKPPKSDAISSVIKQSGLLENPDIEAAKRREHSRVPQAVTMEHWESPFYAGFWMFFGACWAIVVVNMAILGVALAAAMFIMIMDGLGRLIF